MGLGVGSRSEDRRGRALASVDNPASSLAGFAGGLLGEAGLLALAGFSEVVGRAVEGFCGEQEFSGDGLYGAQSLGFGYLLEGRAGSRFRRSPAQPRT